MDGRPNKRTKTKKSSVDVPKKRRLHGNDSCVDKLKEMTDRDNDASLEREEKETPTMAHTDKEDPSKGSDHEDSDGETTYEMNRPTLLRQLQTILGEYPDDDGILREMVQNAEDAGANCMKIMYDSRTRDPKGNSKIKQYFRAAEKALKAIQVCEDAKRVSNYHSLITSVCLKNPTLKQAAQELERCIGDYSKMRYPRPVFFPSTPSDLYSQEDATETIKWAETIVSTVDDMM